MSNLVLYYNNDPILYWDSDNNVFGVLDTDRIPDAIYDHLWPISDSERNPDARIEHNIRVVSNWLATQSNQPKHQMSLIMNGITLGEQSVEISLKAPWSLLRENSQMPECVPIF